MHYLYVVALGSAILAWAAVIEASADDRNRLSMEVVVKRIPMELPPIQVAKHAAVFGRTVENPSLRIDRETRGLADVFLWTASAKPLPVKERRTRTITFEKGNYWPYAQVAARGDLLRYENKHRVPDNFRSPFGDGRIPASAAMETVLDKPRFFQDPGLLDRPVRCDSPIYEWLGAYVFVQDQATCAVTDLRGEAMLCHAGWIEPKTPVEIRCWHPLVGYLPIREVMPDAELSKRGSIRISPDALRNAKLKIVVEIAWEDDK